MTWSRCIVGVATVSNGVEGARPLTFVSDGGRRTVYAPPGSVAARLAATLRGWVPAASAGQLWDALVDEGIVS